MHQCKVTSVNVFHLQCFLTKFTSCLMSPVKTITCKVKMAYIGASCDMLFDFNLPFSTLSLMSLPRGVNTYDLKERCYTVQTRTLLKFSGLCMLGPDTFRTQMQIASPTAWQTSDADHILYCQHTKFWVQGSYHNRQVACCPAQLLGT